MAGAPRAGGSHLSAVVGDGADQQVDERLAETHRIQADLAIRRSKVKGKPLLGIAGTDLHPALRFVWYNVSVVAGSEAARRAKQREACPLAVFLPSRCFCYGYLSSQSLAMNLTNRFVARRRLLRSAAFGAAAFYGVPGLFAEELTRTPAQTEGPFYPDHLPLDTDNDLLIVNDSITPAVGEITHLGGRLLDSRGEPIRNATIEIWQVDQQGAYLHTGSNNRDRRDKNFQGFGRFLTGSTGEYYFRTVKPVAYPGRTPHIHVAVKIKGRDKFTTQCYVKGEPGNERDGILRRIRDAKAREAVIIDFAPIKESRVGELAAKFDIVMGFTPES